VEKNRGFLELGEVLPLNPSCSYLGQQNAQFTPGSSITFLSVLKMSTNMKRRGGGME